VKQGVALGADGFFNRDPERVLVWTGLDRRLDGYREDHIMRGDWTVKFPITHQ